MTEKLFDIVISEPRFFTPRLLDVLALVIEGRSNKEIARLRNISLETVKNYIQGGASSSSKKVGLGLYGITEELSGGKRPNRTGMIYQLLELGVLELKPIEVVDES